MPTDRRRFARIHFDAQADILFGTQRWPAQLEDISLKGALVRSEQLPLQQGDEVELEIHLAADDLILHMPATLVHQEQGLLRLNARELSLEDISHLRRLVELNLGDEELLERELEHLIDSNS